MKKSISINLDVGAVTCYKLDGGEFICKNWVENFFETILLSRKKIKLRLSTYKHRGGRKIELKMSRKYGLLENNHNRIIHYRLEKCIDRFLEENSGPYYLSWEKIK